MNKKLLCLLIFFILISSISIVSANDGISEDYYSDNHYDPNLIEIKEFPSCDLDINENNTIYVNASYTGDNETGSQEHPFKTVEKALEVSALSNNTNVFIANGNYICDGANFISRNLNIIGENPLKTIISTVSADSLFILTDNAHVNFVNLTLANTVSDLFGLVKIGEATVYLSNIIFKNNTIKNVISVEYGGPAIYNEGTAFLNNCSFINNSFLGPNIALGGAIYNKGDLYIKDSTFVNNSVKALRAGGSAIYSTGSLQIINTTFANNSMIAQYGIGGVIYVMSSYFTVIINSTISNTSIEHYPSKYGRIFGSSIAHKGLCLEIINSTIENNIIGNNCYWWVNNTVFNYNGHYYLINSTLRNNTGKEGFFVQNELFKLYYQFDTDDAFSLNETTIPSSYDLRDYGYVTSVKDQSYTEVCYVFASLASLESFLLKFENVTYDFSENHMKNIQSYTGTYGFDIIANYRGNNNIVLAYLLRWAGPIDEKDDPFSYLSNTSSEDIPSLKNVNGVLYIPARLNATDNDQIKLAILNYGAIATSMYYNESYYSFENYSYYNDRMVSDTNHEVCIVGWDDNYSASNFNIPAPGDGAFIAKNSWGTSFGDEGYFYISYYDTSLFKSIRSEEGFVFTDVRDPIDYNTIYQYDYFGNTFESVGYLNETAWMRNVFNATNDSPLSAIGFYTYGASNYEAYIEVNGQLQGTKSGNVSYAGYHTIDLDDLISLKKGDTFSVTVKLTTPTSLFPVAIETRRDNYNSKATSSPGVSFVSANGVNWTDLYDKTSLNAFNKYYYNFATNDACVCLKAYTVYSTFVDFNETINTTGYNRGDLVEIKLNLTNNRDEISEINVSSIISEGLEIQSVTVSTGSYNETTGIWTLSDFNSGDSAILTLIAKPTVTKNDLYFNFTLGLTNNAYGNSSSKKIQYNGPIFRELQEDIDSTTNTTFNLSGNYTGAGVPITITRDVTINGDVTFDAKNLSNIFFIAEGGSLTLNNVKFINSKSNVIVNNGTLFINNLTVEKDSIIQNNGIITSLVEIITLNNQTIGLENGTEILINTTITADGIPVTGNILNLTINDNSYSTTDLGNGTYVLDYIAYIRGISTVIPNYNGSNNETIKYGILRIKFTPQMIAESSNITWGQVETINVTLNGINDENITLSLNNMNFTTTVVNGKATFSLPNLDTGNYAGTVYYNGTIYNNPANATIAFKVIKANLTLIVSSNNVFVGDNSTITISLTGVNGTKINTTAKLVINTQTYDITIINGSKVFNFDYTSGGDYVATVYITNLTNYFDVSNYTSFKISKMPTMTYLNVSDIFYGQLENISATHDKSVAGNITYTLTNGLNKTISVGQTWSIANLDVGTYTVKAQYNGNDYYLPSSDNKTFNVYKSNLTMDLVVENITYGDIENITINLSHNIADMAKLIVNDVTYNISLANRTISLSNLVAGEYSVSLIFDGNNNLYSATANNEFKVSKAIPKIDVSTEIGVYKADITVVLPEDATGTVFCTVNGTNITGEIRNSTIVFKLNDLAIGNYSYKIIYSGDSNYYNKTILGNFTIDPVILDVSNLTMYFKNGSSIQATLYYRNNPVPNETVIITLDNVSQSFVTDKNGMVSLTIDLNPGTYNVSYYYEGDYGIAIANSTLTVLPTIKGEDLTLYFKNGSAYEVKVVDGQGNPAVNQKVIINIVGKDYTKTTDENGIAKLNINLNPGIYPVIATNLANGEKISNNVTVLNRLTANDTELYYKTGAAYEVKVVDGQGNPAVNKQVIINIVGKDYTKTTDENGIAKLNINLGPGTYTVTAKDPSTGEKITNTVTVKPTYLETQDLELFYKNGSSFVAKVVDSQGNPITNANIVFNIVGKDYAKTTDSNGTASLKINLSPGTYTITTNLNGLTVSNKITVKSTLETHDVELYYKSGAFTAKVVDGQGNPVANESVVFNIFGKDYTKVTDENGVASLNINSAPGTYSITTKYNGLSKTNKITVKPTLIGKDITLKYKDGTQYKAQVLDGQGNPLPNVSVKINIVGKDYFKITDIKGYASLTINLSPGTYTVTAEYNGLTISNKIVVKK